MIEYITKEQAQVAVSRSLQFNGIECPDVYREIDAIPPADVVKAVRCKDCKHLIVDERLLILSSNPETSTFCMLGIAGASSDFYCAYGAYGARMDGEEE